MVYIKIGVKIMFSKRLDELVLSSELKFSAMEIIENNNIFLVYLLNKGYAIYSDNKDIKSELYLINTDITPINYNFDENKGEKEDITNIVSILLDSIYENETINDYDKKHPEYVLNELMNRLNSNAKYITQKDEIYSKIDDGFLRLELEELKLNKQQKRRNPEQDQLGEIGNKVKSILNSR